MYLVLICLPCYCCCFPFELLAVAWGLESHDLLISVLWLRIFLNFYTQPVLNIHVQITQQRSLIWWVKRCRLFINPLNTKRRLSTMARCVCVCGRERECVLWKSCYAPTGILCLLNSRTFVTIKSPLQWISMETWYFLIALFSCYCCFFFLFHIIFIFIRVE